MDLSVFEAMPGNHILLRPDKPRFTIVAITSDALASSGRTKEHFVGRSLFDTGVTAGDVNDISLRTKFVELFDRTIGAKITQSLPSERYDRTDLTTTPKERHWSFSCRPVLDSERNVAYLIQTAVEMTETVLAQRREKEIGGIIASEARFRSLVEQAPVATCLFTGREMIIEVANDPMLGYWGKDRSIIGMRLQEAIPELEGQHFLGLLDHVYMNGTTHVARSEKALLNVGGRLGTFYFDYTYKPLMNDRGEVYGIMNMAVDVTDQVNSRIKMEEAIQKASLAISIADLGSYEIDLTCDRMTTSARFNEIWGVTEALSRADYAAMIHPEDRDRRKRAHEQSLTTGNLQYETRIIRPDDSVHWIKIRGKLFFDPNGVPVTLLGAIQDITEQKLFAEELSKQVKERTSELEKKNRELQRSNANLEEFAHAASHDLKEPIRKIHFFTDRLKNQLPTELSEQAQLTLKRIETATDRMRILIDDLLLYSQVSSHPHEMEQVDLNEKLAKVMDDLELDIEQKEAEINVSPLPVVFGYRRQLQQLFQNLISNALKYSKPGERPRITIDASEIDGTAARHTLSDDERKQRYHFITVKDQGIGFDQQDADRIFQLFQRLHAGPEYRGTGIGLSIARKVIENHKGKIVAESAPGKGSTFFIYLPVAPAGTAEQI